MRAADLLVTTLVNAGVNTIYTLSGNQIMPIFDACFEHGIRLVHTRHEAAAVFMAEAHAQLTGTIGVALVTAAPGFTNALGPLFMAGKSETPVLLLSGDSALTQDGMGAFQELDQVAASRALTKHSERVMSAEAIGETTVAAIRCALQGRAGPVHLALPADVLTTAVTTTQAPSAASMQADTPVADRASLTSLLEAIDRAARPLCITGPALNATRQPQLHARLRKQLGVPVVAMESPRGLNDPSLGGIGEVLGQADLVIALGKDLDFTTGFGKPMLAPPAATVMMIDAQAEALQRAGAALGEHLSLQVCADPLASANALLEIGSADSSERQTRVAAWAQQVDAAIASRSFSASADPATTSTQPMVPAELCAAVQACLDQSADPILVIDGGEFGQWAQACLSAPTRIINGVSGAIGGGLCYALAASIARPEADVFLLMGDGTSGFHFAEFETACRERAGFTAIIGHDGRWNAEHQIQMRDYGAERLIGCELSLTRYDQAAQGLGCHGEYASDPAALQAALARALATDLPSCVVVPINGLPAPAAPTPTQHGAH